MTTLYRPVLIETAAQAEALPIGTPVRTTQNRWIDKGHNGCWWWALEPVNDDAPIGGTALVPIEAEEEWGVVQDYAGSADILPDERQARSWAAQFDTHASHRLVTPWEEA